MFKKLRLIFFVLMCLTVSFSSVAQTKKQLQKKREQLQKEIRQINTLLFKSKQQEEALLSELGDLNKRIAIRSRLIRTIDQEEKELSEEIDFNQKEIDSLETSLAKLKKEYGDMIVQSYKSRSKQSTLMFILSYIPINMKRGIIVTIFKGGNKIRNDPNNYRTITLSSILIRLYEAVRLLPRCAPGF